MNWEIQIFQLHEVREVCGVAVVKPEAVECLESVVEIHCILRSVRISKQWCMKSNGALLLAEAHVELEVVLVLLAKNLLGKQA